MTSPSNKTDKIKSIWSTWSNAIQMHSFKNMLFMQLIQLQEDWLNISTVFVKNSNSQIIEFYIYFYASIPMLAHYWLISVAKSQIFWLNSKNLSIPLSSTSRLEYPKRISIISKILDDTKQKSTVEILSIHIYTLDIWTGRDERASKFFVSILLPIRRVTIFFFSNFQSCFRFKP